MKFFFSKLLKKLSEICGDDEIKWKEATAAAKNAIEMRINFWSGISKVASSEPYSKVTTKVEERINKRVTKTANEHLKKTPVAVQ